MLKYFFSILVILASALTSFAQKKNEKVVAKDTIKNKYLPTGLRIGTDAISLIKNEVTKNWRGYEMNADVDFGRYYLAVDYGSWSRTEILSNGKNTPSSKYLDSGKYANSGTYFRIGADMNFMLKDPEKNMFFLGLRYGTSHFKESLNYIYSDSLPGISTYVPREVNKSQSGLIGHWVELTTGLRVKIWGPFWMGYTARLKLAPSVKGAKSFKTFDIPGYGLAEKGNYWGINYQLFWRFPVRKIK
jgi:Domain of unknown function (DUF6048)